MQIFICPSPQSSVDGVLEEYAMIELQGDLESKRTGLAGKIVGDLHYTKDGTPILIIGHHILFGKVQKLEKPFAVLEKRLNTPSGQTEYVIKALIHKKLAFPDRPKPLVSSSQVVSN